MDTSSCGTPSHAAPEVLAHGRMTKQGDIYAFGMIGEVPSSLDQSLYLDGSTCCDCAAVH